MGTQGEGTGGDGQVTWRDVGDGVVHRSTRKMVDPDTEPTHLPATLVKKLVK